MLLMLVAAVDNKIHQTIPTVCTAALHCKASNKVAGMIVHYEKAKDSQELCIKCMETLTGSNNDSPGTITT